MSDKILDIVCICHELIEFDLSFFLKKSFIISEDLNCNNICMRHLTVYKAYSHAFTFDLHRSPVE